MPIEFKFPDVGEGIEEGEIVKWLVKSGDSVKENQVLGQIETDKAVVDIPSPASGKIMKINFKEGDKVKVGQVMFVISSKEEKLRERKPAKKSGAKAVGEIELEGKELKFRHGELEKDKKEKTEPREKEILIKKKYDDYGYIDRIPLKGIRKTIAENMVKSVTGAPQVTSMDDIDVSELWKLREKEKLKFEKKGIKLTFLPFIIKALIAALKKNPILNSTLEEDEIILKKYYNIGVATETEAGLMVPVIKIAESKSIEQLTKEITTLSEKARTRKIDVMDLKGGTFTITNYGSVGGNYGTPIINPPEAAILGIGRIFDRVVLKNENKLENIKILPISLTFDHRVLDGGQAARFLMSLRKFLQNPDSLISRRKK